MPKHMSEPHLIKKISVPVRLAAQIDLLLVDPLTHKVSYAGWQTLITNLLQNHLTEVRKNAEHSSSTD